MILTEQPRRQWTTRAVALAAALNRMAWWQRGALLALVLLPAVLCARWKPLTNDELFTFDVSRLGSIALVWRALAAGADNHPPLDYLLRHLSMSLFGEGALAFRLPSLIAVWIALSALYAFVARQTSAVYGWIALLIPLSTPLFEYSYEGRSYALVVAFAALALLGWQRRTEGRTGSLVLLGLSLAGAVWSHYYGILVFFPIALGEIVLTAERRRLDPGVWAALGVASAAVLPLLPFIRASRQIGAVFWTKVGVVQAVSIYSSLTDRLCIVAVLLAGCLILFGPPAGRGEDVRLRRPQMAAALGFVLLPILCYLLARTITGALAPRYALSATVGIAAAFAFSAFLALRGSAAAGVLVALTLLAHGLGTEMALAAKQRQLRAEWSRDNLAEVVGSRQIPVVIGDNDLAMQLMHFEPPALAARLFLVCDEKAALEMFGWNTPERAIAGLKPWSDRVHSVLYDEFVRERKRFLLIEGQPGYVSRNLLRDGASIVPRGVYRNQFVFLVELPGADAVHSGVSN